MDARSDLAALLHAIADHASAYRADAPTRLHRPEIGFAEARARFDAPVPAEGAAPDAVIAELIEKTLPGLAAMVGPRFFGWVIGGTHPVGMAADWLTAAWGQNTGNHVATPSAAAIEEIAGRWLLELLDLPRDASVGFVTGATMANFTGLAAARGEVLARVGWDCEADGLFGAPPISVLVGEEAHATVFSALRYLGMGDRRVSVVESDENGSMRAGAFEAALKRVDGPTIAILQTGQLNSGAFDPFAEIAPMARAHGAWMHVDGAFGLWARAAPEIAAIARGAELCNSWAVDGHKWLQTPHDCGYVIVRDAGAHRRAMRLATSYLPAAETERSPADFVPELSRRGRGFATWAMIRALGRAGIAAMVTRHCAQAKRFAARLEAEPGVTVMNEVVLNQLAVRLGADMDVETADTLTQAAIARVQQDGVCFVGGAAWRGVQIVRVSIINAATTEDDIDRSADAILKAWRITRQAGG